MQAQVNQITAPFQFANGITVKNRVVMAPMTTWSAGQDHSVSAQELAYYRQRAAGAGMIITGCSPVSAEGIGFTDEFASWDDKFLPSLTRLADATKSGGAVAILQLFHAGNKAVADLVPHRDVVSASAGVAAKGPFNDGVTVSRALQIDEINAVIEAFGEATRRAIEAGFDGIELHGAHGFLLQNFLSPHFNQRQDQWGGSSEKRMAFPLAVVRKVQSVIQQYAKRPFVLGYRISLEEAEATGLRLADSLQFIEQLIQHHISYLHLSLKDALNDRPIGDTSGVLMIQQLVTQLDGRIPLMAAGQMTMPEHVEHALALGLDFAAIGRGLVMNPHWVEIASGQKDGVITNSLSVKDLGLLNIPDKLWDIIMSMKGWFPVETTS